MLKGRKVWVALGLVVVASAGCDVGDYQFRNDHRLTFRAPDERQNVELPVTIRWSMERFDLVGLDGSSSEDRGAFAVFVDRAPMSVGEDLRSLVHSEPSCDDDPDCATAELLAERDVYVTTDTSLRLNTLPRSTGSVGKEQHFVNIVLLDGTGRRIGESAWYLPFTTNRRTS